MPPKRSSKPALSDEEKMLLKEQQAQAAVLEQQRRAEMATKFLKVKCRAEFLLAHVAQEKVEQEEINSRINMKKIDAQWRAILRKGEQRINRFVYVH